MIRIAVVDDAREICVQLEKFLFQIADKYNQVIEVEPFYSGESICNSLKSHNSYDIIFLDIELDKISGIDVGKYIRYTMNDEFQSIVYISANAQYSLQLHQLYPLDFLIKEIQISSVERVFRRFLKLQRRWSDVFEYKYGHDFRSVKVKDIRYLKVENRMITIYLSGSDNTSYFENTLCKDQYYGTLQDAYDNQLKRHDFLYLHKAYLVNAAYVATFEYNRVILMDETIIPIGSSKRKEIRLKQLQLCDRLSTEKVSNERNDSSSELS